VEAGTKLGSAVRQGLSDVHSKFKENQKLVTAVEQAGTKVNEIMKSDDAQAITGHLNKLLTSINSSAKAQGVMSDAQKEVGEGVQRQLMLKLEEHIREVDTLVEKLTGIKIKDEEDAVTDGSGGPKGGVMKDVSLDESATDTGETAEEAAAKGD
jgi:hypothetical protein